MNWSDGAGVLAAPAWFHLVVMGAALLVLILDLAKD